MATKNKNLPKKVDWFRLPEYVKNILGGEQGDGVVRTKTIEINTFNLVENTDIINLLPAPGASKAYQVFYVFINGKWSVPPTFENEDASVRIGYGYTAEEISDARLVRFSETDYPFEATGGTESSSVESNWKYSEIEDKAINISASYDEGIEGTIVGGIGSLKVTISYSVISI